MTAHIRTLVVVPALNEGVTVARVVQGVGATGLDVLVVDDGSTDRTGAIAAEAGAIVVRHPFNLGVGGALRTGFRYAVDNGYSAVIQCDADGQHDPDELHSLIGAAEAEDAHLLVGSRFVGTGGFKATWIRRIPMRVLSRVASKAAGTEISDASSGFRIIREPLLSEFARAYPVHYLGDTFEVLVQAGRRGYRVRQIGITMRPRAGGTPSAGSTASVRYLVRVLIALLIGSSHRYREFDDSTRSRHQP